MVRTKHSGVKSLGGKAPKKLNKTSSNNKNKTKRDSNSRGGGNLLCPRETPQWQKPITIFIDNNSKTNSVLQEYHSTDSENVNEQMEKELIPVEFCSIELNDSTVLDETATNEQNENISLVKCDDNNTKRKMVRNTSNGEEVESDEEGVPPKRIKLSNVQTD